MLRGYRGRMITRTRPVVALALSLVALGMLSGCAPQPEPEPTPSAVFASEEEAFKAAEETYRAYNEVFNNLNYQDLVTLEPLAELSTPENFALERKAVSEFGAEGIVRGGRAEVEWFRPQAYKVGESLTAWSCINISATTFVDASGTSIVPSTRPKRYALEVAMVLYRKQWVVSETSEMEDPSCPPS